MSTARDIDRIADEFEAAWQAGEHPSLADYLAQIDEPLQAELLAALLPLDVTYCRQRNEPCEADDYSVFGDDAVAIARRELAKATTAELDETIQSDGQSQNVSHTDSTAGDRVQYFGEYELLSEIARGGMGVVYKARQVKLNRLVALKMILSGQLAGEQELKRFQAEAEAAAKLDHPGLVPIFEIGEHEGRHFIAMAYVEGRSLAAKLRDEGPMLPKEAAQLVRKITDAIHYAHLKGVVHRDLKPGNVLLDTNGEPRVTDFGLAKQVDTDSELTASGQVLGTPSYMPPEQAAGKLSDIGPASDIYSIGAILYACLTGRPPFQGASPTDVILQVLNDTPPAPRTLNRKVDRDLNTIVMKCLDKPIGGRYPKAAYLRGDLDHYLRGEPIQARPIGHVARTFRWSKRHKALTFWIVACVISLMYPLFLGMAEFAMLWKQRPEVSAAMSKLRQEGLSGSIVQMGSIDDESAATRANVLVTDGLVAEQIEETTKLLERVSEEPIVIRFSAGRVAEDRFFRGARIKYWIEVEKNGIPKDVYGLGRQTWDLRCDPAEPNLRRDITLLLVRVVSEDEKQERWLYSQNQETHGSVKKKANSRESSSPVASSIFEDVETSAESRARAMSFTHTQPALKSEQQSVSIDTWLASVLADESLSDEERTVFKNNAKDHPYVSYLSTNSSHFGNISKTDQDYTLYETKAGNLLILNYWRQWSKLSEKPERADYVLRVKYRLLPDIEENVPKSETDLLSTIDPSQCWHEGQWIAKNGQLVSSQEGLAKLEVPYELPDEYRMTMVVEPIGCSGALQMSQRFGNQRFQANLDLRGNGERLSEIGPISEIVENVDRRILTGVFACETKSQVEITVLKTGVKIVADGRTIIDWKGDPSQLAMDEFWESPNADAMVIGTHEGGFRFHRLSIATISGEGRMVNGSTPEQIEEFGQRKAARMAAAYKESIAVPEGHDNLLTSVDLESTWSTGKWDFKDGLLEGIEKDSAIEFPYTPPDEYRMTTIVEPLDGPFSLLLKQRSGGHSFWVTLAYNNKNSLEVVDGVAVPNETTHHGQLLRQGERAEVVVTVKKETVQVSVDGEQIIDWKGDSSRLSLNHQTPIDEALAICTNGCRYRIHRLSIEPLSGEGRVISDKPIDDLFGDPVPK